MEAKLCQPILVLRTSWKPRVFMSVFFLFHCWITQQTWEKILFHHSKKFILFFPVKCTPVFLANDSVQEKIDVFTIELNKRRKTMGSIVLNWATLQLTLLTLFACVTKFVHFSSNWSGPIGSVSESPWLELFLLKHNCYLLALFILYKVYTYFPVYNSSFISMIIVNTWHG